MVTNRTTSLTLALLIFTFFFIAESWSQTVGASHVQKIEALAKEYKKNEEEIPRLKEQARIEREKNSGGPDKIKREIAEIEKERDNIIGDMKVGARCSQCKEWKSSFEKKGINFQKHLGDVKGYAIPATTQELEEVRASYREKIAYKKVQLKNLEEKLNNSAPELRIRELTKRNESICNEMRNSSKKYDETVFNSGKSKHESWGNTMMTGIVDWLISEDKRAIAAQKQIILQREYREKEKELKEQLASELAMEINKYEAQVRKLEQEISEMQSNWEVTAAELNRKRMELIGQRDVVKAKFDVEKNDSIRQLLDKEYQAYENLVKAMDEESSTKKEASEKRITSATTNKTKLSQYISQLRTVGPTREKNALTNLKSKYDTLIKAAAEEEQIAKNKSKLAADNYANSVRDHKQLQQSFHKTITDEEFRIRNAGTAIGCQVGASASGQVHGNWNSVLSCVDNVKTYSKQTASHVFNSYCNTFNVKNALQAYRSFLSGLSSEEREIVQEISNPMWLKEMAP